MTTATAPSGPTLYSLSDEFRFLSEVLRDAADGVVPPTGAEVQDQIEFEMMGGSEPPPPPTFEERMIALATRLDTVGAAFEEKAVAVAGLMRELEFRAKNAREEAERMVKNADKAAARAEWLRTYLIQQMTLAGYTGDNAIVTGRFTLSVAYNPWSIEVVDANLIPKEYMAERVIPARVEVKPDKNKIKKHWKDTGGEEGGELIPGVTLTRGEKLVVK